MYRDPRNRYYTEVMTDRERWGLKGPVHRCEVERTWYSRKCASDPCETEGRSDRNTLEFGRDGKLMRQTHVNPDGSKWDAISEFDDAGQLMSVRSESGSRSANVQLYEYDNLGRLARVIARAICDA